MNNHNNSAADNDNENDYLDDIPWIDKSSRQRVRWLMKWLVGLPLWITLLVTLFLVMQFGCRAIFSSGGSVSHGGY